MTNDRGECSCFVHPKYSVELVFKPKLRVKMVSEEQEGDINEHICNITVFSHLDLNAFRLLEHVGLL